MKILFKKMFGDATVPTRERSSDAGIDLYATDSVMIPAGSFKVVKLGVAWEVLDIPEGQGVYLQMKSRSGMAFKHDIEVTNAGVIDEEYRGEFATKLYNHGSAPYHVNAGDKVAQGVVHLLPKFEIEEALILSESSRNEKGFGSSGR